MELRPLSLLAAPPAPAPGSWTVFPYTDIPRFDAQTVRQHWKRLHAGQGADPAPPAGPLLEGWALYHSGEFESAAAIGLQHGAAGFSLANQATCVYANYLEPREGFRQALFRQVAERCAAQAEAAPEDCQALFWQAYALGRYSHGINVARAMAQGLGGRLKGALERVIALQPRHADAHVALASFHADVINKVGALVGRMTYGVRAETAMALYERGLDLHPASAHALIEYAHGLLMLHGDARMDEATRLYQRAVAIVPADARQRLDQELARAGLED